MRRRLIALLLLFSFYTTSLYAEQADNLAFDRRAAGAVTKIVVPGGYSRQVPANTARALAMAIEDGLDVVEVEVRRSKDGQHVIFDADRLDGRTSGTGLLREKTLAELQELDAGSWFAPRFAGAKITSLVECLQQARGKIGLLLVCHDVDPEQLARELAASADQGQVAISANAKLAARLSRLAEGKTRVAHHLDAARDVKSWLASIASHSKDDIVVVPAVQLTKEICDSLHAAGVTVVGDATGEKAQEGVWASLLESGVDLVRTDKPECFVAFEISRRTTGRRVLYAAHRGALRYAPENTTASLEAAVQLQADYVEIDVQTTSDGAHFLLHDGTLDRTTQGRGRVRLATTETLRGLDAGSWFGRPFAGLPVPELDEYLAKYPPHLGLYFDAKDITPEALADAVARHGLVERTVVYQGPVYLEKIKAINPAIRTLAPVAAASHVDTLAKRLKPYAVDT
ncbi:MAG: glycerophosphodiester phosphodiesterase family protein, partial [Singulisphaera sp.]